MPVEPSLEAETSRLVAAIGAAPLRSEPAPHIYVEGLFSDSFYERIVRDFPAADEAFTRWRHEGDPALFFGSYGQRLEIRLPRDEARLPGSSGEFWRAVASALCGSTLARALVAKFDRPLRQRFGAAVDERAFAETHLRAELMLDKHEPGYYLGPHTDYFEKVMAGVFYMPEHAGLDHLGTALYAPREPGFTCRGTRHHDPARFVHLSTFPFRPNSALFFARDDAFFHGVERFGEAELGGSERRGFQVQFREAQPAVAP